MIEVTEQRKRQRTCVACMQQGDKKSLHRIVRNADNEARLDPSGKAPGRGAYICSEKCLKEACKARRLDKALRMRVGEDDCVRLCQEYKGAYAQE